jgi:regulator of protease activity HflC (stomatin/prohibitin superfamily)
MLVLDLALFAVGAALGIVGVGLAQPLVVLLGVVAFIVAFFLARGFFLVQPNEAIVLVVFGKYRGTVREAGWYWTNPFASRRTVSLKVRNFTSPQLKVNDADGNPIEIACVVVWRVVDTARASFDVEDYMQFVQVQSETAIRHLAAKYPYDVGAHPESRSLRGNADDVAQDLRDELQARLELAGVDVREARLTHLAYSAEIAGAMLQRQQAAAILAARARIVEGAVSMVEGVLKSLDERGIVRMDEPAKAEMVKNLLVVLVSERGAQPVVATSG